MIDSITRITLNLQETNTMVSIRVKRGDTGRKLLIHLSDGSIPYHISDDCYATFTAKKPDGTKINNPCTIENNVIEYEFTDQTCTAVGTMKAEIRLYGADDKIITSACFLVNVYDTVFRDGDEVGSETEMNTLDDLILRANAFLNETGKLLRWQGNWDSESEYEANDLVLHEDVLYVAEEAIAAGTAPGSEEVTAWVPIAGMGTGSGADLTEQVDRAEAAAQNAESAAATANNARAQAQASANSASSSATRAEEAAARAEEAAAEAGNGSGGMFVTLDETTKTSSHSASEIREHFSAGGIIHAFCGNTELALYDVTETIVCFAASGAIYQVTENKSYSTIIVGTPVPYIGSNGNWWLEGEDTGNPSQGDDYVLTQDDKTEIAEMAAKLVEVPDSGGNVGCLLTVETITVGEGGSTNVAVTGIILDYSNISLTVDETMMLAASISPSNATNKHILWKSSNTNIATVINGYVTAVAEGNAVITAYSAENNAIEATCSVAVAAAESGGETDGKIYFSTQPPVTEGMLAKYGATGITEYNIGTGKSPGYYQLPYSEGMFVGTYYNGNFVNAYPPIMVLDNGAVTRIATEAMAISGTLTFYTATLTGFTASAIVYVNTAPGGEEYKYYIPGGAE